MRSIFLSAVLVLGLGLAVYAGNVEDGQAAFDAKDYATALTKWKPLAEKGDPAAQAGMGLLYFQGAGVPRDHAEAGKWWTLAAEQGNARAQFQLAFLYSQGLGGYPKDPVQAYKWWDLAASQGVEEAKPYQDFIVKKMTPEQVEEAKKLSKDWTDHHKKSE